MSFDTPIDRRGTHSTKWDMMEPLFKVPAKDGLAMWIADMDFSAPEFLQQGVQQMMENANYGYFCGLEDYHDAVCDWMQTRHGWQVRPEWQFSTFGLGHGIAMCLNGLTEPGDEIAIFTPVYHEFAAKISKTGRVVKELPLIVEDGVYRMDFDHYESLMSGRETMMMLCSPHNPAGRIWTQSELEALAEFARRHDLLVISDEIHADLTFSGHTHLPTHKAVPDLANRLICMTSASKTFNIAGARLGCVTIPDATLRARFAAFFNRFDLSPNLLGVSLTQAAYSAQGAAWVDELTAYLEGNYHVFRDGLEPVPGLKLMPMQGTYLAWVDFSGTGMERAEIHERVYTRARIAATPGHTLGSGGEHCLRFNLGTQRTQINEAVERLHTAFDDLQ